MTSDKWGAIGFIAVYLGIKLIDYLLPGGHHFRWADKWATKDKENTDVD